MNDNPHQGRVLHFRTAYSTRGCMEFLVLTPRLAVRLDPDQRSTHWLDYPQPREYEDAHWAEDCRP